MRGRPGAGRRERGTLAGLGFCLAVAALTTGLSTAGGPVALGQSASDAARQLEQRRQQNREKQEAVQRDIAALNRELGDLNKQLIEKGQEIQRGEVRLNQIEAKLADLEVQANSVRGSLQEQHDQIARLMAAMQRMGRNPPPVIITKREDALEMVRSAMLLARAFPEMRQQAETLAGQLNELVRVVDAERAEREKLRTEQDRLLATQTQVRDLFDQKKRALAQRQPELEELRKAAADLSRDTTNLTDVLARLDRTVAERTNLGDYEAELRAREAMQAPAGPGEAPQPAQPAPKGTEVAMLPTPKALEIAPRADAAALNPGRLKPSIAFASARGRLPLPVVGRKVLNFGERTQFGGQSKGVVLETRHSAQVVSPADGWIVYAGPFRSYGQLLIINPGSGYHILLAGMHQIDVQLGQFVLASEPVGTMAPAPRRASQDNAPVLYVEFRKDQRSIDPEPWWADSVQKVQG
jgi:septal ring factor EnvC (AmiA/AmiB activator)